MPGGDELGVVPVMADGMPSSSFLAGQRVEAVVGDDVEAVLALHDVGHAICIDDFGANPKIIRSLVFVWRPPTAVSPRLSG